MIDQIQHIAKTQPTENFDYTVIIPTWNNLDYLKLCIGSLKKNSKHKFQIIVVVNEGSDGTLQWIENQPNIDFVYSPTNIGICFALNATRKLIKSQYIVYMNDDMYVLPNWDFVLLEKIKQLNTKQFMISATMIEPTYTGNNCVVVANYGDNINNFDEKRLLNDYQKFFRSDWLGSTWPPNVVHIDTWDLVGAMSIEFSPGMYSDPDLSMKLYKAGVRHFVGIGNSLVYHFGTKSTKRIIHNTGKQTFILKWGITSNTFMNKILKRGRSTNDKISETIDPNYYTKGMFKRIIACLKTKKQ